MKFYFDGKADAIYLCLDHSKIIESEEAGRNIVLDFDEHDQVMGIEILNVRNRVLRTDLLGRLRIEGNR
jgi:uncharacterized protein YuzE